MGFCLPAVFGRRQEIISAPLKGAGLPAAVCKKKGGFTMTVEPQDRLEDKRRKNWFWDYNDIFDVPLSAQAKLVRLYLARCADQENRQAWPSLSTIAKHCGISRTTVKKAITELLETGWLDKRTRRTERGDYATTVYILCHPAEKDKLTENLPSLEGGRLTQSLPCHEMTGGGSPHDPPCHEMTGVGRYTDRKSVV